MKMDGRRTSTNVEDRRGKGAAVAAGGIGLGGLLIYLLVTFMGGDASAVMEQMQQPQSGTTTEYVPTAQEQEFELFASQVLASTEDVWTAEFAKYKAQYRAPKMVLFKGSVQSGCGNATSATGPFYCSADEKLYLDLDFFNEMQQSMGIKGDFACAYVIAHEVGHHIQHLLGTLDDAHQQMARMDEVSKNKMSVRIELQADYYAGVWGHHEQKMFGSLEDGDLQEAINAAQKIGDDYLQRQAGYRDVKSDLFTHGTSQQRMRWLKRGLQSGDISQGDTFSIPESQL
jgi:hypothetical protein